MWCVLGESAIVKASKQLGVSLFLMDAMMLVQFLHLPNTILRVQPYQSTQSSYIRCIRGVVAAAGWQLQERQALLGRISSCNESSGLHACIGRCRTPFIHHVIARVITASAVSHVHLLKPSRNPLSKGGNATWSMTL